MKLVLLLCIRLIVDYVLLLCEIFPFSFFFLFFFSFFKSSLSNDHEPHFRTIVIISSFSSQKKKKKTIRNLIDCLRWIAIFFLSVSFLCLLLLFCFFFVRRTAFKDCWLLFFFLLFLFFLFFCMSVVSIVGNIYNLGPLETYSKLAREITSIDEH